MVRLFILRRFRVLARVSPHFIIIFIFFLLSAPFSALTLPTRYISTTALRLSDPEIYLAMVRFIAFTYKAEGICLHENQAAPSHSRLNFPREECRCLKRYKKLFFIFLLYLTNIFDSSKFPLFSHYFY